ncbi:hypothetical protein [Variovorax saccharolyticus]|uniref:hypothetical protein n=1 Tax=Variovorax saccharolyticus TaxID=3053516 RepID=UPI0025759B70|nr:hypothetical protein [Variovorax sp. J31P216]MDM0025752.1 hypothetical protein [Variovorax sp. J31P216]
MAFDPNSAANFLTPHLREDRKRGFLEELKNFPPKNLYVDSSDPEALQGDGWRGVTILNFDSGARDRIMGMVLSNSCDISGANVRAVPLSISFAPLVTVARYEALLRTALNDEARVNNHLADVKAQRVSSMFFLPDPGSLGGDSIAILDDVRTMPLARFADDQERVRLFTLSDVGYWLFLFKLAYHFCRFHEGIDRSPSPESTH